MCPLPASARRPEPTGRSGKRAGVLTPLRLDPPRLLLPSSNQAGVVAGTSKCSCQPMPGAMAPAEYRAGPGDLSFADKPGPLRAPRREAQWPMPAASERMPMKSPGGHSVFRA